MSHPDKEKPAGGNQQRISAKPSGWKRLLKVALGLALIILLLGVLVVGALVFKYHRIVNARLGELAKRVQSGELGRRVDPFVGTCGLSDTRLDRRWIRHSEIEEGGVLRFLMSPDAVKNSTLRGLTRAH
jgi:putative alpha-1,2-mannosidase